MAWEVSQERSKNKIKIDKYNQTQNSKRRCTFDFFYSHKSNHKGLVTGMIVLVHHQFHARHLSPGIPLGTFLQSAGEILFPAQGLIHLHGFHNLSHLGHGLVVFRESSSGSHDAVRYTFTRNTITGVMDNPPTTAESGMMLVAGCQQQEKLYVLVLHRLPFARSTASGKTEAPNHSRNQ